MNEQQVLIPLAEKKAEAVARMKAMKIYYPIIRDFKGGRVQYYEGPWGAGYWLTEAMKAAVAEFEKGGRRLVWGLIRNVLEFGECWSMLYVSDNREEWEAERSDLTSGYPMAYVYNATCPEFSELGTIGVRKNLGGTLTRTA